MRPEKKLFSGCDHYEVFRNFAKLLEMFIEMKMHFYNAWAERLRWSDYLYQYLKLKFSLGSLI